MKPYLAALIPLAALAAQAPLLYRAKTAVVPTPQRFVTPTLVEPAIVNPPGFRWAPAGDAARYELEIARTRAFTGSGVRRYSGIELNLFTPDRPLEPGRWYWRVRAAGQGWPEAHEFELASGLPKIPVPPVPRMIAHLREIGYPRIFLTRINLDEWRGAVRRRRAATGITPSAANCFPYSGYVGP